MTDTTRPRVRTLWILAAAFAVTGVLLLYPWTGDRSTTVGSSQPSNSEPDGHIGHPDPVPPSLREAEPATPTPATPTPGPAQPEPTRTPPTKEPEPWRAAATAYAHAFTARVEDHAEWVAGLKPWVTRHLAEQYEHTDPARRPRGAVDSIETVTPGDYSAHVKVAYETGLVLMVRVANGPDGWRVTYAEPVGGG